MKRYIDKDKITAKISKMMDIDGFRDGDYISRKACLAIIDAEEEADLSRYEDDLK